MFFKVKKARILILSLISIFIISLMFFLCTCRREINQIQIMYPSEDIYYTFIYDDAAEEGAPGNIDKEIADKFIQYKSDKGEMVDLSRIAPINDGIIDITGFRDYDFKVLFYDTNREIYIVTKPIIHYTNSRFCYRMFKDSGTMSIELMLGLDITDYYPGDVFVLYEYGSYFDRIKHKGRDYIIKGICGILLRVVIGLGIMMIFAYKIFDHKHKRLFRILLFLKSFELIILNTLFFNNGMRYGTIFKSVPCYTAIAGLLEYIILKRAVKKLEIEGIRESELSFLVVMTGIIIPMVTLASLYIIPMI